MQQSDAPLEGIFFHDFDNSHIPEILKEIYLDKIYDRFFAGKKDLIVADWGANIGLTSNYFRKFAKVVYAVEPSKSHQESLQSLIAYNKIPNIHLCPYAISNFNGKEKFYLSKNTTAYSFTEFREGTPYEEVDCLTPDEFFKREKIDHLDFLKFDIEGMEGKVLNSEGFKTIAPKIKAMVMEYHAWNPSSLTNIIQVLVSYGFTVRRIFAEAAILSAERI